VNANPWLTKAVQARRTEMKRQKTEVKMLRISKETLLPLGSRQMNAVAGGRPLSEVLHGPGTVLIHAN
jgi:hypothetical protein